MDTTSLPTSAEHTHETPCNQYGAHTHYAVVAHAEHVENHGEPGYEHPYRIVVGITVTRVGDGGAIMNQHTDWEPDAIERQHVPTVAELDAIAAWSRDLIVEELSIRTAEMAW
jgi:hypothetical protein